MTIIQTVVMLLLNQNGFSDFIFLLCNISSSRRKETLVISLSFSFAIVGWHWDGKKMLTWCFWTQAPILHTIHRWEIYLQKSDLDDAKLKTNTDACKVIIIIEIHRQNENKLMQCSNLVEWDSADNILCMCLWFDESIVRSVHECVCVCLSVKWWLCLCMRMNMNMNMGMRLW